MEPWIVESLAAHRRLERALEALESALPGGSFERPFLTARDLLQQHYLREDVCWNAIQVQKMTQQHDEVLELAGAVEEALAAGHQHDAAATVKRFLALASHNLIEEERDWFPLL